MKTKLAIVVPYYSSKDLILEVVKSVPSFIDYLIIVDDCSPEKFDVNLVQKQINSQTQLFFLKSDKNLGVGGATKLGFEKAIALETTIVIKVDADNQMDLNYLPKLISPLKKKKAQMVKGNRFRNMDALKKMPFSRRFGNLVLSFLIKIATGYWNNFDPTNGYFAINTSTLRKLNFKNLSNRYFFETSLLAELYFQNAIIKDVPMPAIYGDEKSSMTVWKMPFLFVPKLFKAFIKRIVKSYFLYNFNIGSLFLIIGVPLLLFGLIFGIYTWWVYSFILNELTPTGTIMIITLSIILGFQLIMQAIQYDIHHAPSYHKK